MQFYFRQTEHRKDTCQIWLVDGICVIALEYQSEYHIERECNMYIAKGKNKIKIHDLDIHVHKFNLRQMYKYIT